MLCGSSLQIDPFRKEERHKGHIWTSRMYSCSNKTGTRAVVLCLKYASKVDRKATSRFTSTYSVLGDKDRSFLFFCYCQQILRKKCKPLLRNVTQTGGSSIFGIGTISSSGLIHI